MPGQIREHTNSFDLDLLVLRCQQKVLKAEKHFPAQFVSEQRLIRGVVVKNVGDATDCVEYELLIRLNCPSINRLAHLPNKFSNMVWH